MKKQTKILIPLTVPAGKHKTYVKNYTCATQGSGRLFLFAGDQKIEHMNDDFYGKGVPKECADPEHMFKIAEKGEVGAFATQLGLIARYGNDYKKIPYIVKLNGKTNVLPKTQKDPFSNRFNTVCEVADFQERTKLNIVGVGYTVYIGSEFEHEMLLQAAHIIHQAHHYGMLAVLWMYPRGKAVTSELDAHIIAGAAGVGACMGADFVKVNPPQEKPELASAELLKEAVAAAGRTGVICSGGSKIGEKEFLQELRDQLTIGGARGCAVGRNIHQRSLVDAVKLCKKIKEICAC